MSTARTRLCPILLLAALCGCAKLHYASMPRNYPRLPSASSYAGVWIEGRFYVNHAEIFGEDLLKRGIVPVALRVFLRDEGLAGENPRALVEDIRPELYLPDGTALPLVSYDRMNVSVDVENRVTQEALDLNVIVPEDRSEEGFVFFRLPRGQFRALDAETLVHVEEPLSQELRISDSLVAFEYFTEDEVRPIYVGLRKDRR